MAYKLRLLDADRAAPKRSAVTQSDGARPTLVAAIEAAIACVRRELAKQGGGYPTKGSLPDLFAKAD